MSILAPGLGGNIVHCCQRLRIAPQLPRGSGRAGVASSRALLGCGVDQGSIRHFLSCSLVSWGALLGIG
eukprot:3153543-Pyramimonas_sp.AAC.1